MNEMLDLIFRKLVDSGSTPGVNYGVISNGICFKGSIGLKSKYRLVNRTIQQVDEKNNINTIYDIASLTKVVCTLPIIFRLYEQGKLDINDKVKIYLPEFKYDDITIYDLLTHTSGLGADFKSKKIISKEEAIQKIFSANREVEKGTFLYSDIGYMLLGLIIESVCDKSLDKVFEEEVAIPLQMKNARFNPDNKEVIAPTEITDERGVVRGIVHDEKACSMNGVAGHAGVFCDLDDLINFVTMILNNGTFKGKKYLDKSTIDRWFTKLFSKNGYDRSFCFFVGDNPNVIEGEDAISFNGFTGPSISIDRKKGIGIVMLTNRIHPTRDNKLISNLRTEVSKSIYRLVLKEKKMKINYDSSKDAFDRYVEECREKIRRTFFKDDYLKGFKPLRNSLIASGKISADSSISDAIKYERLQMIDIKINHTMRVVEDVLRMAEKMGTPVDFNKVLKISALLHDIGRFDQATWNNSFSDACYRNVDGINNHAEAGYHILFNEGRIDDFDINKRLYPAIGSVVYNHGNPTLKDDLAIKLKDVKELDIERLTGLKTLNNSEKVIVAALVQMVRDVDMLDILYQHLTGEFPVIRDFVNFDVLGESIYEIAKYWNISPVDILEYNGVKEEDIPKMSMIKIPVCKIDKRLLEVPQDIKDKFYNNEDIDLKETMARRDWTFITGMWWRLNHFLNNINFTSNLQLIDEKKLLDQIFAEYPDEYKFLVIDAFLYAEEMLVKRQIEKSNSDIYINRVKV